MDEVQQVYCTLPDGGSVTIGTFTSAANETQWISSGGDPSASDPAFSGCCIQGNDWAATVDGVDPLDTYFNQVIKAIGGRQVQG